MCASLLQAFLQSAERGRAQAAELQRWFAELGWEDPERAIRMFFPIYPLLLRETGLA